MDLAPGTRLGAYEVVGLIGAGGMGEVYREGTLPIRAAINLTADAPGGGQAISTRAVPAAPPPPP